MDVAQAHDFQWEGVLAAFDRQLDHPGEDRADEDVDAADQTGRAGDLGR